MDTNIKIRFSFFLFTILSSFSAISQESKTNSYNKNWFYFSVDIGTQMSGIKNEDFIPSNYSPLIRVTGGKWLNSKIAIQVGYQGRYFYAIADNLKHSYDFYFLESVFNAKNILLKNKKNRIHDLLFHVGFGYFQNHFYGNSSFHGMLGASNNFSILENLKLKFDISAIVGWDIYQGNKDILPSISLGLIYKLNNF